MVGFNGLVGRIDNPILLDACLFIGILLVLPIPLACSGREHFHYQIRRSINTIRVNDVRIADDDHIRNEVLLFVQEEVRFHECLAAFSPQKIKEHIIQSTCNPYVIYSRSCLHHDFAVDDFILWIASSFIIGQIVHTTHLLPQLSTYPQSTRCGLWITVDNSAQTPVNFHLYRYLILPCRNDARFLLHGWL